MTNTEHPPLLDELEPMAAVSADVRSQFLQENIRWKDLDEIYKIYMLLHPSDVNISEKFRQTSSHLLANFCKNSLFLNSSH